jgi:hypothetical protein
LNSSVDDFASLSFGKKLLGPDQLSGTQVSGEVSMMETDL